MRYGWDANKAESNLAKHGVSFEAVEGFEWATSMVRADVREGYGEARLNALGAIGERLHFVTFTIRRVVWIISIRRASRKEVAFYANETSED